MKRWLRIQAPSQSTCPKALGTIGMHMVKKILRYAVSIKTQKRKISRFIHVLYYQIITDTKKIVAECIVSMPISNLT